MIRYFSRDENIGKLGMWLFLLTCFSYPITAVPIASLGLPSTPINMTLKGIFCGISLFILLICVFRKNEPLNKVHYVLFLFWLIYSIRLIHDISFAGVKLADGSGNSEFVKNTAFQVYSFFFLSALIPSLAIIFTARYINLQSLVKHLIFFLVLANVEVAIYLYQNITMLGKDLFAERANIMNEEDVGRGVVLNTISIGYYGQQLAVNALAWLIVIRKNPLLRKMLLMLVLGLGFFNVMVAASRSPLISLVLLTIVMLFYNFVKYAKSAKYLMNSIASVTLLTWIYFSVIQPYTEGKDFALLNRLIEFQTDRASGGKEYRDFAYASAWNDFVESPVIGKQFLGTFDNFYPHNFLLETLMATGLIGGILMLIIIISLILRAISSFGAEQKFQFLALVFVFPKVALAMTSGCLFTDPDFWILLSFFLSLNFAGSSRPNQAVVTIAHN